MPDLVGDELTALEARVPEPVPACESLHDRLVREMQASLAVADPRAVLPLVVSPARALALESGEMYPTSEEDQLRLAVAGMLVLPEDLRY